MRRALIANAPYISVFMLVIGAAFLATNLLVFVTNTIDGSEASGAPPELAADHDDHAQAVAHEEGEAGHEQEGSGSLHVALDEWSITGAHKGTDSLTADAGEVVFEVHNEGAAPHNLFIVKTDLAADALPMADNGTVNLETAGEVIGGVDEFPGGEIRVETYHLEPGHYVLICTIPGHYQQGMFVELTVQ